MTSDTVLSENLKKLLEITRSLLSELPKNALDLQHLQQRRDNILDTLVPLSQMLTNVEALHPYDVRRIPITKFVVDEHLLGALKEAGLHSVEDVQSKTEAEMTRLLPPNHVTMLKKILGAHGFCFRLVSGPNGTS